MVIIWAVNSSSKYLVSVSDVTWGLKGGLSCRGGQTDSHELRSLLPAHPDPQSTWISKGSRGSTDVRERQATSPPRRQLREGGT